MEAKTETTKTKLGSFSRALTIGVVDEEARTVELAFSSETPVERHFGAEILDHSKNSVMLDWLSSGRAPLLADHDLTNQIGVVASAKIDKDRVGRAVVRFGKSDAADTYFRDVKDGIRSNVSLTYRIHQMVLEEKSGESPSYRVSRWEPLEISIVSIPADQSVGIGRSAGEDLREVEIISTKKESTMTTQTATAAASAPPAAIIIDADSERARVRDGELHRIREITALGARHQMAEKANEFIGTNRSIEEFRIHVLENLGQIKPISTQTGAIGLSDKEARDFSFVRAIHALANPGDHRAQEAAKYEREVSNAASAKRGTAARGFMVPIDVLRHTAKRDLLVGTATAGGNLVQTSVLEQSFIDMMRAKSVLPDLGATMLTDLTGQVAIPRNTASSTAFWVAENANLTESQQAFDQVALSPKSVGAFVDISRQLTLQAGLDIETFVRNEVALTLAKEIDRASMNGSGASNQPRGIINTAGIGAVAGGVNGAQVAWANIVALETAVGTANADIGNLAYVTNAAQRGRFKSTTKTSPATSFIWDGGEEPVNGYRAVISNQIPSNLVKGSSGAVCSAILFGNWADLIVGMWGGLDLLVNPYIGDIAGTVRVTAFQSVDVAVRQAGSFAAMLDAL